MIEVKSNVMLPSTGAHANTYPRDTMPEKTVFMIENNTGMVYVVRKVSKFSYSYACVHDPRGEFLGHAWTDKSEPPAGRRLVDAQVFINVVPA